MTVVCQSCYRVIECVEDEDEYTVEITICEECLEESQLED